MSRPKRAFIYQITCVETGESYIGSTSMQGRTRLRCHYSVLRKGSHSSIKLQEAWDQYGERAFRDKILERCAFKDRLVREQWYLDSLQPSLNTSPRANGHLQTETTRRKIGRVARRWWKQNDQTPAQREGTLKSLELGRAKSRANKPGWVPTHRIGVKDTARTIRKRSASKRAFHAEQHAAGIRNWWITDGESEQMILSTDPIQQGWRRGRKPKIGEVGRSRVGEKRSVAARKKMSKAHKGVALSEAHRAAQKRGWIERRQEN